MMTQHNYNVREPKYSDTSGNAIDVVIDHPLHGTIPYTFIKGLVDDPVSQAVQTSLDGLDVALFEAQVLTQEQVDSIESSNALKYLASTDWVVTKIMEAGVLGEDTAALVEQYKHVIAQRRLMRAKIK